MAWFIKHTSCWFLGVLRREELFCPWESWLPRKDASDRKAYQCQLCRADILIPSNMSQILNSPRISQGWNWPCMAAHLAVLQLSWKSLVNRCDRSIIYSKNRYQVIFAFRGQYITSLIATSPCIKKSFERWRLIKAQLSQPRQSR